MFTDTGTFTATDDISPSASGYGGTSPTYAGSASEDSYGVYVGLETDLTSRFSGGIAARFEDYSSWGNDTVYKLNGIFKVTDAFSVRATLGSGFHAPSPGQNNVQVLTTTFIEGQSVQVGTYPVTSAIAQYFGAQSLKPATADNYGVGFVFNPTNSFSLTADVYRIDVSDRIYISQAFIVTAADIAALPELASVGEGGNVQYFTNSLETETTGLDLVATYATTLGAGDLGLTLAYNYNENEVTDFDPAVFGPLQISTAENLAPNHRANLQVGWANDVLGVQCRRALLQRVEFRDRFPGPGVRRGVHDRSRRQLHVHGEVHADGGRYQCVRCLPGQGRPIAETTRCSRSWAASRMAWFTRAWAAPSGTMAPSGT